MATKISLETMEGILSRLREDYKVYAPKVSHNNLVRYMEISTVSEIVWDRMSDFSPKEVFYPILQTMMYFNESECIESEIDDQNIIILARPCDINGIGRLDRMFLENGGTQDLYYARRRNKLKIFMLECTSGWDNCFCVSMGANITQSYDVALRIESDGVMVQIKNQEFNKYFDAQICDFEPKFIHENIKKVTVPHINDDLLPEVYALDMWKQYDEQCIACGSCNAVCIGCSCFDTVDILYCEGSRDGERRRVWGSCMQEAFTAVAGGHKVRNLPGARMRFKTLHKTYGFRKRFGGENMCVGCGRCDMRCPEKISFSNAVNQLSEAAERIGGKV